MSSIDGAGLNHHFASKIKALGYGFVSGEQGIVVTPLHSNESWRLTLIDERWVLIVNHTPQIAFSPDEALKFLTRRLQPRHKLNDLPVSLSV